MNADVVVKPWGREYCCYRNAEVAVWALELRKGLSTSLHCHPKKNTALIVLRGEVELSFLRRQPHRLTGLDKINVFRGRFHQTRALTDGVVLLEVEAPDDKRDILRLEDDYGRVGAPIEEATAPWDSSCLRLFGNDVPKRIAGCWAIIQKMDDAFNFPCNDHIFVTLTGGLERGLVPPGDAIDGATLARFAHSFPILRGTTFLHLWRQP